MMRHIWEKFRAALGIFGANHRTPPTLSAPDYAAAGEGLSHTGHAAVGEEGGESDEDGGSGCSEEGEEEEDLLSALPDDILLLVLLRLPSAAAAARTCVLSRRWSRLWTQLPELRFPLPAERTAARTCVLSRRWSHLWAQLPKLWFPSPAEPTAPRPSLVTACAALARHEAPALRLLRVVANDADPRDVAAVLHLAAPRLTNELNFHNVVKKVPEAGVWAAVEMPCFDRAERLILRLGYLGLVLPPSGVFRKLTMLDLAYVQFPDAWDIGNAFSSARCPSSRHLRLVDTQGVSNLAICSDSLLKLWLETVRGLQQLTVVSPMLIEMTIAHCFFVRQPMVDIVAPVMKTIMWIDRYDPISVHLGEMVHLRVLATFCVADELPDEHQFNWGTVKLLHCFQKIPDLFLSIVYPTEMVNNQYLKEALTFLPAEKLCLHLVTSGHVVISCVFHLLKISTSIRSLILDINEGIQLLQPYLVSQLIVSVDVAHWNQEHHACSPGCVCHQPQDWISEELCLNSLETLDVRGFGIANCDFAFVKRLLGWTPVLKTVNINFDPSTTVGEDLCKELLGLSGPDTCMKVYIHCDETKVMYTPQG